MPLDHAHVVPRLLLQALRGQDLVVAHEEADRVERLSYVDDAVDTLLRAMDGDRPSSDVVAPFIERTVEQIASTILEVVLGGARSSDPLEEGIERTLRAMEDRIASVHPPQSGFFDRGARQTSANDAPLRATARAGT